MSEEQVQTNPIEAQARDMGWLPKEEYEASERDPAKWVPAEIFVARAPLFEKIDEQHKYNKALQKKLDELARTVQEQAAHTEKIRQTEFKRALEVLKAEKRQAIAEEDHLRADEIQDRIDATKEAIKAEVAVPKAPQLPDEFVKWSEENPWYSSDEEMKDFADAIGLTESKKGKSPTEVLKIVTEKVRKHFPEKFRNPMKDKAPTVETQNQKVTPSNTSKYKPTPEEREIARRFAQSGVMTEEQYYKDLEEMNKQGV